MSIILKYLRGPNRMQKKVSTYIALITKNNSLNIFQKIYREYLMYNMYKIGNIIIGQNTVMGNNIKFPHPQNIVIGEYSIIGNNVVIYQDVTIGQNRGKYPIIGDNVIIYPGAKVIGGIRIGDNVVLGANSVTNNSIESNSVVAGNPGIVIKRRDMTDEYY